MHTGIQHCHSTCSACTFGFATQKISGLFHVLAYCFRSLMSKWSINIYCMFENRWHQGWWVFLIATASLEWLLKLNIFTNRSGILLDGVGRILLVNWIIRLKCHSETSLIFRLFKESRDTGKRGKWGCSKWSIKKTLCTTYCCLSWHCLDSHTLHLLCCLNAIQRSPCTFCCHGLEHKVSRAAGPI